MAPACASLEYNHNIKSFLQMQTDMIVHENAINKMIAEEDPTPCIVDTLAFGSMPK